MFQQLQLLLKRLFTALFISILCRIIFFAFNSYFHQFSPTELFSAFAWGILYDVSAMMYVHGLFIFCHLLPWKWFINTTLQKIILILFLAGQFLILLFNLLDTGYFPISGKRSGMEIFAFRNELDGLFLQYLLDYWYLFAVLILLIWLQYYLYKLTYTGSLSKNTETDRKWFPEISIRLLTVVLVFIGARGGLNLLPLNTFDAARQTRPELVSLVVNTPFNMIISTQQAGLKEVNYMWEKEAWEWFDPIQKNAPDTIITSKKNLVLIIVESLGKEYVGYYNQGNGYTPFLDSLMHCSEVYLHAYANGKKSIEGIPSIMASMPSWMSGPYLSSYYQSNTIQSMGAYLQQVGYDASFYHGGKNGTMSFDNFIALSKGGKYFGKNEYPDIQDFDGHWGIYDRPYLQYFARELSRKKEPFFSTLFTLTSHHPYRLPAAFENTYPKGSMPIHQTIAYTDDALRAFFAYAKTQEWYPHTVFMLTADHSAENEKPYYQSAQGKFEVPFFIFRPEKAEYTVKSETVSHLDILSLGLSEVHYPESWFSFGSLNASRKSHSAAVQFHDQYYQIIQWPFVYQFDGTRGMNLYDLTRDSLMKRNLIGQKEFVLKRDSMDHYLKALIQTYNNRIRKNNTVAGK